jgi:hypothetical protein
VCALSNTCNQFKEFLRGLFVPATLYEDIKDVVVLIHRAPQIMALTVNGQKYHIPPDCVVDGAPQRVRTTHVLISPSSTTCSRHNHRTLTSAISMPWNFTTQSGGIWGG